ncbi:MAG: RNA degradosome polyphosphate kinase, partial [Planctomycetes bacterium]|nr:RNA degradosome polyphosphate kinase [Planctomycetota bacterium]
MVIRDTAADGKIGPECFINRELSWLEFNQRVLEEAENPENPLMERLKFLAIFSSNLDEFFMVRVAGLKHQLERRPTRLCNAGLSPGEQLARISRRLHRLALRQ